MSLQAPPTMFFFFLLTDFPSPKALSFFMKLFTHINDNILHRATVADFLFRP